MCARGVNDPYKNPPVYGHGHNHPVYPPKGPLPHGECKDPNLAVAPLFHEGNGTVSVKLTGSRCIAFLPDWVEEVYLPEAKGSQEIMFAREKGQMLTLKVTWAEDMVLNGEPGPASYTFQTSSLVHLVHRTGQEWVSLVQAGSVDTILEMIELGMITFTQDMVDAIVAQATTAQLAAEAAQGEAENQADRAETAAETAALYEGPWIDDISALLSDTTLTYFAGVPSSVAAGDYVRTRAEGFSYRVMPPGTPLAADGYHIATAGGVLLQVVDQGLPTPVEAFGVPRGPVGGVYTDSTSAIQLAWDWAGLYNDRGRVIHMTGDYAITATLTKGQYAQITSDRRSVMRKLPGAPNLTGPAVFIANGNHLGRTILPSLSQFAGVVVEVQGDIGHIYVPQFNTCGTAWKVSAGVTDQTILDCVLEFDAISNCDVAAECYMHNTTAVIQGLLIKGNFITNTTDGLIVTGAGGYDDGIVFDVLAVDFTPNKPGGALFDNRVPGHVVPRLNAYVRSWLGGEGFLDPSNPTQLFKGRWDNVAAHLVNAADFTDLNQTPNLVRGSSIKLHRDTAVASALELGTIGDGQAGFNGGRMLSRDTFLAKVTLTTDVGADQTTSRVFFHAFGDANYQRFSVQKQQGAGGMIVESVHDQTGTVPGRVAISFRNVGTTTIPAGSTFYVAVQRY